MSDSSDRAKPASVAAFLFLPQFGKMFRGSSHLVPVFIRTVAQLFVQAELLPPTHPAALYGEPGVEKCGFFKMMGDAWYSLRVAPATPYQWSVFCSVLLMIFVLLTSVISMVYSFSTTFVGTAAAQIFTSSLGPTDIANMPGPQGPCTSQTPLCRVIPDVKSAYGDYAIDLLDKMLRLGANQSGGPLQNATGALMQVYNAGILFVAACLLFWLIISVVVDIAKTGQVGGGRHNLVWAPIRIVFALGMMVPLGSSGFSSGQFVVMKIAEWGSNFGTNGWNAYLNKVMSNANVVPSLSMGPDLMPLVGAYERMWVCKVAHNGYGFQSEGTAFTTPTDAQEVNLRPDTNTADTGQMSYAYSNLTTDALCGRVTFPTGNDPTLQALANPPSGAAVDPIAQNEAKFKIGMAQAWMSVFVAGYPGGTMTDQNLPLATLAKQFACGFVAQHIWGTVGTTNNDVLYLDCSGSAAPQCGSGAGGSGKYPDLTSCVDNPNDETNTGTMTGVIGTTIMGEAKGLVTQLQTIPAAQIFGSRGWADMGSFYKSITTLTSTVKGTLDIPVKISAPGVQDSGDNQSQKVQEVMGKFNDWWNTVPNGQDPPAAPAGCNADPIPDNCPQRVHNGNGSLWGGIVNAAKGATNAVVGAAKDVGDFVVGAAKVGGQIASFLADPMAAFLKAITNGMKKDKGAGFLGIPDPSDPATVNKYPLEILSSVGVLLMSISTDIYIAVTVVEVAAACIPTVDIGNTIAASMIGQLINILGEVLMSCGFILLYYLPLLPYIRVAHAVLVWMISVFEAVMLVPIACLTFLDTEKEGMYAKHPFINWLDVLVRPILTVIGYVGAILVFDAFFGFLQSSFTKAATAEVSDTGTINHLIAFFANSVIFTFIAYTAANSCFKMISMIPDAFFRWMPGAAASGASQLDAGNISGAVGQMGGAAAKGAGAPAAGMTQRRQNKQQSGTWLPAKPPAPKPDGDPDVRPVPKPQE